MTSGGHQSNPLLKTGQASEQDEVAQVPVPLAFQNLEGWRFHSFAGQPVPPCFSSSKSSFSSVCVREENGDGGRRRKHT